MTTTNTYGRQVVVPLTNKSGGAIAAGDVVIVDTSNNDAFTTTTTGAFTGGIGIAQETIASNATGRVLLSGYAALINVNASVTRGNFGKTHTVAKQATDAGSSRIAGTFCIFLTGGTTPDALVWQPDLGAGSGLTDPMTTRGDIIIRNSSNTTARLAVGATANMVLASDGTDVAYKIVPGTLLGITAYKPGSDSVIATITATSGTDCDATNLQVTFTAPASGNVLVRLSCLVTPDNNSPYSHAAYWGLRESSSDIAGPYFLTGEGAQLSKRKHMEFYLTGLSAGSHTYKWSAKVASGGSMTLLAGTTWGQAIMEVWSA